MLGPTKIRYLTNRFHIFIGPRLLQLPDFVGRLRQGKTKKQARIGHLYEDIIIIKYKQDFRSIILDFRCESRLFMKTYDGEAVQTEIGVGWMRKQKNVVDNNNND